jgi:hypothetical protein
VVAFGFVEVVFVLLGVREAPLQLGKAAGTLCG